MNEDFINRILARTNFYRSQFGLPPLTLNPQLTVAAQEHSQNMALQDFNAHTGADGSSPGDRLHRAGYQYSWYGENIAVGQPTPEQVVDTWFNEVPPNDGHRKNILNPNFKEIGIGFYFLENDPGSEQWRYYWTQDFGTPLNSTPISTAPPPSDPMFGTDNSEVLTGGADSDFFVALGGNDTIDCTAGDDYANGNIGNDWVSGDDGSDYILGGQNEDVVMGGIGDDGMVNGNKGDDLVYGGDGSDTVHGGQDSDICDGENGDDYLAGDLGADTLIGGAGSDIYVLRGDIYDIVYYDDAEDFLVLPDGVSADNLSLIQGFDEYVADGVAELQLVDASTGQVLAVLPGVDASSIDLGDFLGA